MIIIHASRVLKSTKHVTDKSSETAVLFVRHISKSRSPCGSGTNRWFRICIAMRVCYARIRIRFYTMYAAFGKYIHVNTSRKTLTLAYTQHISLVQFIRYNQHHHHSWLNFFTRSSISHNSTAIVQSGASVCNIDHNFIRAEFDDLFVFFFLSKK